MSDLTDRLRAHVANMPAFPSAPWQAMHEAADEIDQMRVQCKMLIDDNAALKTMLANARAADIHSCHADCTRAGCVNARLREQLALAEVVRASQVAGLTNGLEALRAELAETISCRDVEEAAADAEAAELRERVRVLESALRWYGDEAAALAKNTATGAHTNAVLASVTVLSLDGGNRARVALASADTQEIDR